MRNQIYSQVFKEVKEIECLLQMPFIQLTKKDRLFAHLFDADLTFLRTAASTLGCHNIALLAKRAASKRFRPSSHLQLRRKTKTVTLSSLMRRGISK